MRIITVNLPQAFLDAIEGLVGETGLYSSRSELIRVAVREWLLREMAGAQAYLELTKRKEGLVPPPPPPPAPDPALFVQVPGDKVYRLVERPGA